jgi:hypothetical protein
MKVGRPPMARPVDLRSLLCNPVNPWERHRELPAVPEKTFHQWPFENRRKQR